MNHGMRAWNQLFSRDAMTTEPLNMQPILLAALYKFVTLDNFEALRPIYKQRMLAADIKGTILLAHEGINGTISGTHAAIREFLEFLRSDPRLADLEHKESCFDRHPFTRTKVRLKKEIISMGIPANPNEKTGTYLNPQEWNTLLDDPEVVLLDSRNDYETHLGTFKGAIDPNIDNFKQLPAFVEQHLDPSKHKKIATFCTGGIRCEKFTTYLLDQGFEEVYHLKGGILKYLEEIPAEQSLWEGDCFVFDKRVGVGHNLEPSIEATMCFACGHPLLPQDRDSEDYIEDLSCPYCPQHKKDAARKAIS
jgi:UPF0176 protein